MKQAASVTGTAYSLRPMGVDDQRLGFQIYASTRAEEMALVPWTDEQKEAFLTMQFNAQSAHYSKFNPTAEYSIILCGGQAAGRLIMERSPREIVVMDIALLPQFRGQGVGTTILQDCVDEARQAGLPLVLRVEFFNPAIRLYTRLGFVKTKEVNSVYHEMVWDPKQPHSATKTT